MLLSDQSLGQLAADVRVPAYDRRQVRARIVHVGVGGFHRAHEAMYLDRLMNVGSALEWGICGVGLLPSDRRMAEVMRAQDCLYTLVKLDPDGSSTARVIGSIVRYLYGPDDPEAVLEAIAAPATRIVSLTITEGGYDLSRPAPVFEYLTEGLSRRKERGTGGLTVLSCDNVEHNGATARASLAAFAEQRDPALAEWIGNEVRFPNSMVDRITPVTTDDDRRAVSERINADDGWPVKCESFAQWVVEDDFACGRPPLEAAGVQVVGDVVPYEQMKMRMLNGGHQAVGYLGYLAGHRWVDEACSDEVFERFVLGYMTEASRTLPAHADLEPVEYRQVLMRRFVNPHVRDTLARLCQSGSDRMPKFVLPVLHDNLAAGGPIDHAVAVIAGWARYCAGTDEAGDPIAVDDQRRAQLVDAARRASANDPLEFLQAQPDLFGGLAENARFAERYRAIARSLQECGVRATLAEVVG